MAKIELLMPKMGESIIEATILKWVKKVGDKVSVDDTILEIATDKVDSEIPSPVDGILSEILFPEDSVVEVGKIIAIIATAGEAAKPLATPSVKEVPIIEISKVAEKIVAVIPSVVSELPISNSEDRFYSPLVKSIAKEPMVILLLVASIIYFISGKTGDGIFLSSAIILVSAISLTVPSPREETPTFIPDLNNSFNIFPLGVGNISIFPIKSSPFQNISIILWLTFFKFTTAESG
jgi:hypothetical protein